MTCVSCIHLRRAAWFPTTIGHLILLIAVSPLMCKEKTRLYQLWVVRPARDYRRVIALPSHFAQCKTGHTVIAYFSKADGRDYLSVVEVSVAIGVAQF